MEKIGKEINRQLSALQHMAEHEKVEYIDWSESDEAKLQAELASIGEFNPDFETPFSEIQLPLKGAKAHHTNNFVMKLGIVDGIRKGNLAPENSFESAYAKELHINHLDEISAKLEQLFPAIYKKVMQFYQEFYVMRQQRLPVEGPEREARLYLLSQAYQAAAGIARQTDPAYPLSHLW